MLGNDHATPTCMGPMLALLDRVTKQSKLNVSLCTQVPFFSCLFSSANCAMRLSPPAVTGVEEGAYM